MNPATQPAASILVVDDTPANLQLFGSLLHKCGYGVRVALSGSLALQAARLLPPDLILLDVRMPKMDGYEVCRQLKADPRLRDIPVIFVSAHGETEEKVRAFKVGGVDYVTKPFQTEEIEARVGTHLELHRLQQEVRRHNTRLEELVRERTRQLAESNARLELLDQAKTDFLTVISHELRTPLQGLLGAAELAFGGPGRDPLIAEYQQVFESSRQRVLELVEDALLLSEMRVNGVLFAHETTALDAVLADACRETAPLAAERGAQFISRLPPLGAVAGSQRFLIKALTCLLETAIRFTEPGRAVTLEGSATEAEVRLQIIAEGRMLPAVDLPRFFELLSVARPLTAGSDLGLSPAVAGQIIKLHGGRVEIANRPPVGIELRATLSRRATPGDLAG
jgi:CheY-like chemotaxis protein